MSSDIYTSITEWEHHPKVIIALAHLLSLGVVLPADNLFGAIIAAMLLAIPTALIIFIPYLAFVAISALCLSLLQVMRAALRRSNPSVHSSRAWHMTSGNGIR